MSEFGNKVRLLELERSQLSESAKAEAVRLLAAQKLLDTAVQITEILRHDEVYPEVAIIGRTTEHKRSRGRFVTDAWPILPRRGTYRRMDTSVKEQIIGEGWFLRKDVSPQSANSVDYLHHGVLLSTLGHIISYQVYDVRPVITDNIYFNQDPDAIRKDYDILEARTIFEPNNIENLLIKFVLNQSIDYSEL